MTENRASGHYVQLPMGSMTMYQFADFSVGHVTRHQNQLDRALKS